MLRILKKILKNRTDFNNKTLKYLEEIDEKHHKKILKKHKNFEKEQAVFEAQFNSSSTITDEELDEILNLRKKRI